jgi:dipeptidyl aminopeptidase/acylaminoacyl peptidase
MRSILLIFVLLISIFAAPVGTKAKQAVPLRIEDVLDAVEFEEHTPVEFSPDGRTLVYVVSRSRKSSTDALNHYGRSGVPYWAARDSRICVVDLRMRTEHCLAGSDSANWSPHWSWDGRYLGFLSDRGGGQAAFWVWDLKLNTVRQVSGSNVRAEEFEWLPRSHKVLITVLPKGFTPAEYEELLNRPRGSQSGQVMSPGASVVVYDSHRADAQDGRSSRSDPWALNYYLRDLALLDAETGHLRRLTHGRLVAKALPSPDGLHIAFTSPTGFERPASQQIVWNLKLARVSDGKIETLAKDVRLNYGGAAFSWSNDSGQLAYRLGGFDETARDCYVVYLKDKSVHKVTSFHPAGRGPMQGPPLWSLHARFLYFIRGDSVWKAQADGSGAIELGKIPNRRVVELTSQDNNSLWSPDGDRSTVVLTYNKNLKESGFYRMDLRTGHATKLLEGGECYTCINVESHLFVSPSRGLLAYFSEDAGDDAQLWMRDADFDNPRRLTHLNPRLEKYRMGVGRLVHWFNSDGKCLEGALLLPAAFQEGKRYPLVVWVYGNAPLSDQMNRFGMGWGHSDNFQLLATRGYAVLLPNAPQRTGTPMADLAKDVLPAVDKLVEMGIADPDRVAVMGHSYGAYCVLSLLVQTNRFKAAVMEDGFGDLLGAYGQMGEDGSAYQMAIMEGGQGLMGGTPWQFRYRYTENSPVYYLDRVETPLLLVQGAGDTAVHSFLADQVFVDMRRLGREVQYAKYEGEGHAADVWSRANQMDLWTRILAWFQKYLK